MGDNELKPKPVAASRSVMSQFMMPTDANPNGHVHGGTIMKLVDEAGAIAAMRHARRSVVTIVVDSMTFLEPVYVGDLVTLKAQVNWVGRSSLEVGVRVTAENVVEGTVSHTSSAHVVYVALDDAGRPASVPPLLVETDEEERRMAAAEARRERRLREKEAYDDQPA